MIHPDMVLVAWDSGKPTFRHETYTEYKGTRKELDQELIVQFPIAREYLDAYGLQRYECDGIEADDIIGCMARQHPELEIHILSSDRDLLQLIDPTTDVYLMKKGISEIEVMNEEKLMETAEEEVIQTVEETVEDIKEEPVSEETPSVYQAESALPSEEEDLVPTYEVPEPPSPPVNKAGSSTMKFFIGIVVLVVLLCVGAVTFMYYPDLLDRMSTPSTEKVADEKVEKPAVPVALTDSIVRKDTTTVVAKKDTVAEVVTPKVVEEPKPVAKQGTPATAPKKETKKAAATPFEPDSVNYKIVGTKATHTIQEGETLTKVALRFYGTKALWPYIVKYNSGVIKNPDHVPYGTVIKIPELEKK